jgi:hypothetical protein
MNSIDSTNKIKNLFKQVISLAVPQISEAIYQNWVYLKRNFVSNGLCNDYKECIRFEVYVYILFSLNDLGNNNGISDEIREYIREVIEHSLRDEFGSIVTSANIDNRLDTYATTIKASSEASQESSKTLSTYMSISRVFFGLLKRISTASSLTEYVNIPKTDKLLPWHISDLELSNSISSMLTITIKVVLGSLFEDVIKSTVCTFSDGKEKEAGMT